MQKIKDDALFIIDASYLLYRSYYGLKSLQTTQGLNVQAVYGFCRAIQKLIDLFDPNKLVIAWDSKGKTFRSEIYQEYKATRTPPPSDLFIQKNYINNFLDLIGVKQISKPGYEADDLIGSMAQDHQGTQVVIVGPDKDLYQLLDKKTLIYDPFKEKIIDQNSFKEEKGYEPNKVPFFYSLLGDSSDNIPGVAGIGKKTATEIVKNFESLEDLYNNLDKLEKERTKKLLLENKKNAFLSLKLFLLEYLSLNLQEEDFNFDKKNLIEAVPIFEELEFESLLKKLKKNYGEKEVKKRLKTKAPKNNIQTNIFEQKEALIKWNNKTITDKTELKILLEKLKQSEVISIDTETTGLNTFQDKLVGISFAFNKTEAFYIPFSHKTEEKQLNKKETLEALKPIFSNKKISKVLHNSKFDQLVLKQHGINIENITFDTLIAANLLRKEAGEKINLKFLSNKYLKEHMYTFKQIMGNKYKNFSEVPLNVASEYAAYDALQTFKLKEIFEKQFKEYPKLYKIFKELEMPLNQVLFKMELAGIKLNKEKLKNIGKAIDKELEVVESKIFGAIEQKHSKKWLTLNLNSPKQIQIFLFDELKLPVVKKTIKGQRGTGQEVLEELSKLHPIPGLILRYRELSKLKSTYIQPLIDVIIPKTERIHTTFSQILVSTGRLSSTNPNLQNIPTQTNYNIRSAFQAEKGNTFIAADYSQIELRILAHLTKDKKLIEAFKQGIDIHKKTASQIFETEIDQITKEQRQIGKKINFSIVYGLTPYGLSKDLNIKYSEAKKYIEKYFKTYKNVADWIEKTIIKAKEQGYVETLMGRRRYIPGINEKNKTLFQAATRIAINTPVQGTAAELIKKAMIKLDEEFAKKHLETKILLQIHDELVIETPEQESKKIKELVKNTMENSTEWVIPIEATIKEGKDWEKITK